MNQYPVDSRTRRYLPVFRAIWQSDNVQDSPVLLENDWGQALVESTPSCQLNGANASILLDFERELHGGVQLVVGGIAGNKSVRARLRFGESVSEAMGEPNGDHANHDFEILLAPMSSQEYGQTGFRFVRLDLLEDAQLPLTAVRAVALENEPEEIGSFSCSDERLNQIWRVGRQTVRLCLQDYIWDGIKRDRLVWLGDLHPEISVVLSCYGALDIVPRSLDWVRDHTPLPNWMNGIGSYSMWWVILQRDWYRATADLEYLEQQRAYLSELLPLLIAQVAKEGDETAWTGHVFLDWPSSPNRAAVLSGLHALLGWCLENGAELCEVLGEKELATCCREAVATLRKTAPPLPPSEEAGLAGSKQAAALLVLAKMAGAITANDQVLSQSPLQSISTFYGFYTLKARAMAGDMQGALDVIRTYWGAMLDLGATSFWEDFDMSWLENAGRIDEVPMPDKRDIHFERGDYCYKSWRHSLCHGWAAGPTAFLSESVLGVQFLEDGGKKVKVTPNLGDLVWAEGTFPTPHGPIQVRHEKLKSGQVQSRIDVPNGIEIAEASSLTRN